MQTLPKLFSSPVFKLELWLRMLLEELIFLLTQIIAAPEVHANKEDPKDLSLNET